MSRRCALLGLLVLVGLALLGGASAQATVTPGKYVVSKGFVWPFSIVRSSCYDPTRRRIRKGLCLVGRSGPAQKLEERCATDPNAYLQFQSSNLLEPLDLVEGAYIPASGRATFKFKGAEASGATLTVDANGGKVVGSFVAHSTDNYFTSGETPTSCLLSTGTLTFTAKLKR